MAIAPDERPGDSHDRAHLFVCAGAQPRALEGADLCALFRASRCAARTARTSESGRNGTKLQPCLRASAEGVAWRPNGCTSGRHKGGHEDAASSSTRANAMDFATDTHRNPATDEKGVSILARSLFRQMREQGYSTDQIIALSSELIELVRENLQRELAAE